MQSIDHGPRSGEPSTCKARDPVLLCILALLIVRTKGPAKSIVKSLERSRRCLDNTKQVAQRMTSRGGVDEEEEDGGSARNSSSMTVAELCMSG